MFRLQLKHVVETPCLLGEGLFVDHRRAYWIDISKRQLWNEAGNYVDFDSTPSVILSGAESRLIIGAAEGLIEFNTQTGNKVLTKWSNLAHEMAMYRSNDGVQIGNTILLGFMSRKLPESNPGFLYCADFEGKLKLFDDSIHIPNSFVPIGEDEFLISDSLQGKVWRYRFDKRFQLASKELWHQYPSPLAPDGGCIISGNIFISLWDGHAISILTRDGKEIQRLELDVPRPTNCKYSPLTRELWVTSAKEGLTDDLLSRWPESGKTFKFLLLEM